MPDDNPYYGFEPEEVEGPFVKSSITPPWGLGGAIFPPQETRTQEHQHAFCFAVSNDAALRGCETCGKSWILLRISGNIWGSWQEVEEV